MFETSCKYVRMFLGVVMLSVVCAASGYAHDTWIVMQNYTPKASEPAVLNVANAHLFAIPGGDFHTRDRVEKVFFLSPDDKNISSAPQGETAYQSDALKAQGTYLAVALPVNGFFSKTTEGYQRGKSKKDIKDVIECTFSEKYAKALFTVGTPGGNAFSKVLGHTMEIVPMADPATLKEGDELSVKVLFEGKPASTYVYGTYAGFSKEANTFGYTTHTDKDGVAKIRLIKSGTWLLLVKQEKPYPNATECDKKSCAATLTFQIR